MLPGPYPQFSSKYPLLLKTFMMRPVDRYPQEIGLVYRNHRTGHYQRFTWQQWYQRVCRLAHVLERLGVKPGKPGEPGDRVGTMALNTHRHMELYFAVPCVGASLHCINVNLSMEHIVYTIKHAEDEVLLVDDVLFPIVEKIYDQIKDTVKSFVYMSDGPELPESRITSLYSYEALLAEENSNYVWPELDEDNLATLCYTTATTGLPKGAMFTHRALYLQTLHLSAMAGMANDPQTTYLGENAVPMITTPLFHVHGWGQPFSSVFAAHKIVMPGAFTIDGFCDLIETERVTHVAVVPTILALLLEKDAFDNYDLSSLVNVRVGGGALPLGLKDRIEKKIPGIRATSGYGMTETAPVVLVASLKKYMRGWSKEELDKVRVKTGLPIPGLEVNVVDHSGAGIPHDGRTPGEIVVRGPWVMESYYKNPEKTAEVWHEGWFHTGDLATIDDAGYIDIADRVSDIIRSGSEMVPTLLIEKLISMADFVLEVAVVGVPDDVWGEKALALVKTIPGSSIKEDDVIQFLIEQGVKTGKITKWMLPKLVALVDDVPKTSVGKFNKRKIREDIERFVKMAVKVSPNVE